MPTFGPDALAPWFATAGAIPIIIHLLNRQQYRRVRWAAMEFLLAALKRVRRRLQFENLILLLVRILILTLLGLALARPTFQKAPLQMMGTSDTLVVICVDNSYSMGYDQDGKNPFGRAQSFARELIRGVQPKEGDKLTVIAMNDHPSFLIGKDPTDQVAAAEKAVTDLELSDYATSVTKTVALAQEAIRNSHNSRKKVYLLTDMQKNSWFPEEGDVKLIREQLVDLSTKAEVVIVDLGTDNAQNVGVTSITPSTAVIGTDRPVTFNVEFHNFGTAEASAMPYNFIVDGQKEERTVTISPGGTVPDPCIHQFREPGAHMVEVELEGGDRLKGDNHQYFAVDVRDNLSVLLVDGESKEGFEDEVIFLKYALCPTEEPDAKVSIYKIDEIGEGVFTNPEIDVRKYDLVILANVASISDQRVQNLESFVAAGGGLWIWLGEHVDRVSYNTKLFRPDATGEGKGLLPEELTEVLGQDDVPQTLDMPKVDMGHEVFKHHLAFRRDVVARLKAYHWFGGKVDVSRPDIKVLATFDDKDSSPAIVEKQYQRGKVMLCTTSAGKKWQDWVGSPAYLILADQTATYLASQKLGVRNFTVGDPLALRLKQEEYRKNFILSFPEKRGGRTEISPFENKDTGGFELVYNETETAGFYSIYKPAAGTTGEELFATFAANVEPKEGDLARATEQDLKAKFPGFEFTIQNDSIPGGGRASIKPPASNIWKYLAWTVFAFLFVETLLAAWFGRAK